MQMQTRRRRVLSQGMSSAHRVPGMHAVVNVYLVSAPAERLAKTVHIRGVAAEAVTAKKSGDHAKLQERPPVAFPRVRQFSRARADRQDPGRVRHGADERPISKASSGA